MDILTLLTSPLSLLFSTEGWPPRWFCGQWSAFHGWASILADVAIWGAYTSIPLLLVYFVSRRRDVPFPRIFWLFAAFIYSCGTAHLLDALVFWWPAYRLLTVAKVLTALASWLTVIALIPTLPRALALKSPRALEREILERREAEARLEETNATLQDKINKLNTLNRELEAFSYSVSHDLRAPLRSIDGFACHVLEEAGDRLSPQEHRSLARVRANAQHMAELIDDILDLARLSRKDLHVTPVDLSAMARDIVAELAVREPERRVTVQIAEGLFAQGDAALIRVMLENLLENAWKFTSREAEAQIVFESLDREGQRVFVIRDNGVGFDMAYADKLFRAFQRLHSVNEFSGTGIGLATVMRIVERHGGTLWAESNPGKGAAFFWTLPETPPAEEEEALFRLPAG